METRARLRLTLCLKPSKTTRPSRPQRLPPQARGSPHGNKRSPSPSIPPPGLFLAWTATILGAGLARTPRWTWRPKCCAPPPGSKRTPPTARATTSDSSRTGSAAPKTGRHESPTQ